MKAADVEHFSQAFQTIFSGFQQPIDMAIRRFWNSFHDSTRGFQNTFKALGYEIENTSGFP
jgi:hypothetical protein